VFGLKKKLQEVWFSYGIWSASINEVAFNSARAARLAILLTWTLLVEGLDMIYAWCFWYIRPLNVSQVPVKAVPVKTAPLKVPSKNKDTEDDSDEDESDDEEVCITFWYFCAVWWLAVETINMMFFVFLYVFFLYVS